MCFTLWSDRSVFMLSAHDKHYHALKVQNAINAIRCSTRVIVKHDGGPSRAGFVTENRQRFHPESLTIPVVRAEDRPPPFRKTDRFHARFQP